jgi:hypothetical protein
MLSPTPDAPAYPKVQVVNDAETVGATSAEAPAPGPIGDDAPGNPMPSVIDRVPIVPLASGCGRKCLHHMVKQSNPVPHANEVMTQVELPPYRGSRSPLDLVVIEIVFGRIFEMFRRMSHVAAAGATIVNDDKHL